VAKSKRSSKRKPTVVTVLLRRSSDPFQNKRWEEVGGEFGMCGSQALLVLGMRETFTTYELSVSSRPRRGWRRFLVDYDGDAARYRRDWKRADWFGVEGKSLAERVVTLPAEPKRPHACPGCACEEIENPPVSVWVRAVPVRGEA
jgi:hypothetical protein